MHRGRSLTRRTMAVEQPGIGVARKEKLRRHANDAHRAAISANGAKILRTAIPPAWYPDLKRQARPSKTLPTAVQGLAVTPHDGNDVQVFARAKGGHPKAGRTRRAGRRLTDRPRRDTVLVAVPSIRGRRPRDGANSDDDGCNKQAPHGFLLQHDATKSPQHANRLRFPPGCNVAMPGSKSTRPR